MTFPSERGMGDDRGRWILKFSIMVARSPAFVLGRHRAVQGFAQVPFRQTALNIRCLRFTESLGFPGAASFAETKSQRSHGQPPSERCQFLRREVTCWLAGSTS